MIKWIAISLLGVVLLVAVLLSREVGQVEARSAAMAGEKDEVIEYLRAEVFELEAREKGWEKFCKRVQFKLGVLEKGPETTGQGG